jgi:AraC family transcriptional regulator of adaptative response / DNA-3-methyladenine glycosylase II
VQSLRTDPVLVTQVDFAPGLRVPACWNGFELATRAILGQQITVKGATVLAGRMVSNFGKPFSSGYGLTHLFTTPEVLADAKLTCIGLTGARAETVRALAWAVCDGRISFESGGFRGFVESVVRNSRDWKMDSRVRGYASTWETDAFPSGDLGLLRAMALKDSRELAQQAEAWRPWRAYAAMYLWRIASQRAERGNRPTASSTPKRKPWGVFLPASTFHWLYDRKTLPLPPTSRKHFVHGRDLILPVSRDKRACAASWLPLSRLAGEASRS